MRRRAMWYSVALFVFATLIGRGSLADSDSARNIDPPQSAEARSDAPEAAGARTETDEVARARQSFQRGIELAQRGEFDAAIVEFRAAYRTRPHYSVLYNLAQALAATGKPAEALKEFERYLAEGGDRIDSKRRAEVERMIEFARKRIGYVKLVIAEAGLDVTIDGQRIGKTPLDEPLALEIGKHAVVLEAPGRPPAVSSVTITGGDTQKLRMELPAEQHTTAELALVELRCTVPDVQLALDGKPTKQSALWLKPGTYRLTFSRPGYRTNLREVVVRGRQKNQIDCNLLPTAPLTSANSANLRVTPDPGDARVTVNGTAWLGTRLPAGRHRLQVSKSGYLTHSAMINLRAGEIRTIPISLQPTPEQKAALQESAKIRRTWAIAVGGAGAGLLSAGGIVYLNNNSNYETWQADRDAFNRDVAAQGWNEALWARNAALQERAATIQRTDDIAMGLLGVGAALGAASLTLLLSLFLQ